MCYKGGVRERGRAVLQAEGCVIEGGVRCSGRGALWRVECFKGGGVAGGVLRYGGLGALKGCVT